MNQNNDPIFELITSRRIQLLFSQPFYGTMLLRLKLVDATDSGWCNTAATDGKHLYFHREFIKKLDARKGELDALLIHEILHVILDHVGRRNNRHNDLWNMAIDFLVNYTIRKEIGENVLPENGLYDKRFTDEMTADEIYDILLKESTVIKLPLDCHLDSSSEFEEESEGDDGDGNGKQEVEVRVLGKNGPPKLSRKDLENLRTEIQAQLIQTAQSMDAGKVPLGIQRLIKSMVQPVLDWRNLLDAHIRSCVKDDFSFQFPSRRSTREFVFPGHNFADTIDIFCWLDASGSIADEQLRDFVSEVYSIMQSFPTFKLRLASFDTQVYNYKEFTESNIDEIHTWMPDGHGGTSFEVCFDYMKEHNIMPERMVMFTDGYPNYTWGDPLYTDVLWIIQGNTRKDIKAPFGTTVYYEDSLPKTKK